MRTLAAALVIATLGPLALATHPPLLGWESTGVILRDDSPIAAKISFGACAGPTWVVVDLEAPGGPVRDAFRATFEFTNPVERCPNYVPDGPVRLYNDAIDVELRGAIDGIHFGATLELAGVLRGDPAAFVIAAA